MKDPFEKPKNFEMKQRFDTVAGGLEALAQAQLDLAQELAKADPKDPEAGKPTPEPPGAPPKKPDPNRIEGTFTERQTLIAQRVGALLNEQALPPEVNTHLESGQGHARESLRQLDAEDLVQAREPAAAAARELRLAAQTMDRLGEDNANDKLADALNRLNRAAEAAREAGDVKSEAEARRAADEAAAQTADAREKLADAARQQQEAGSSRAAARLANAARALDDQKLRNALKKWHDQPRNQALAQDAAEQLARAAERVAEQQNGKDSAEEIAKLIERVERTRTNFERLAAADPEGHPGLPSPAAENAAGPPAGAAPSPGNRSPDGSAAGEPSRQRGPEQRGWPRRAKGTIRARAKARARPGEGQGQDQGQGDGGSPTAQSQEQGSGHGRADGRGGVKPSPPVDGRRRDSQPARRHHPREATTRMTTGHEISPSIPLPTATRRLPRPTASPVDHRGETAAGGGGSQGTTLRSAGGLEYSPVTERAARELLADLRDETLEARAALVSPDARHVLEELHPELYGPRCARQPRHRRLVRPDARAA